MKKFIPFLYLIFLLVTTTNSQSYIGHGLGNYSGIHGVILNPSAVADSPMKMDINIISVSGFAGSDYLSLDKDEVLDYIDDLELNVNGKEYSRNDNQIFANVDILGPSLMYKISPIQSLAITSRLRSFINFNNISGNLVEDFIEDFASEETYSFGMYEFSETAHLWGEIGITYGRVLMQADQHFFKGGLSLKYLMGAGSIFSNSPELTGRYNMFDRMLSTSGTLDYGSTPGFDSDYIEIENTSSGLGGDIGFTYEYRNSGTADPQINKWSSYKIKVGLSVTDIGSISYKNSEITNYNMNNSVDTDNFENKSIEEILDENYSGEGNVFTSKINLPTAFHILVDYNIKQNFYLSLNSSLSMISGTRRFANRVINTVTAMPRFETKLFSFYLPLSVRQYEVLTAGTGFRFGPLTVGSGSILSNLFSDRTKSTDVYASLKVPIYR